MWRLAAALFVGLAWLAPAGAVSLEAILADKPPAMLSAFGFFDDPGGNRPAKGVLRYDMATPLFTDHALKARYVFVPPGRQAAWSDGEVFAFPVGSALVKTFSYPADLREPGVGVRHVETRVLVHRADGWAAFAYVWNEGQTDAALKLAGAKLPMTFVGIDGTPVDFTYAVPNRNQCKGCHAMGADVSPIGPKARNINRVADHGAGPANQIAEWVAAGILSGAPDPATAPAVPDWRDEGQPVAARARAWLDVNCAHCHRREGPASNSGLFLTYGETDRTALGINKRPVAAGRATGDLEFDIVPGDPDASLLVRRVESAEAGVMMPEIGRSLVDGEAVALLRSWIATMH